MPRYVLLYVGILILIIVFISYRVRSSSVPRSSQMCWHGSESSVTNWWLTKHILKVSAIRNSIIHIQFVYSRVFDLSFTSFSTGFLVIQRQPVHITLSFLAFLYLYPILQHIISGKLATYIELDSSGSVTKLTNIVRACFFSVCNCKL